MRSICGVAADKNHILICDYGCSGADPDKMNYDVLAETTRYFKENEEGGSDMCRVMEEKFHQGEQKATLKVVLNMINMLHMTSEQALHVAGVPESEYEKYEKLIKAAKA